MGCKKKIILWLINKASCGAHFSTQHEANVARNPCRACCVTKKILLWGFSNTVILSQWHPLPENFPDQINLAIILNLFYPKISFSWDDG